jgi:hypothetical protein
MNDEEQRLADFTYQAIQRFATGTERSIQAQMFKVGISDLGHCQEYVRRSILQEPLTDVRDYSAAFVGTAVGDYVERALLNLWPGAIRQQSIKVILESDQGTFEITGHPDIVVIPGNPSVIDVKTVDGLGKVRRTGPTQQQIFQRNLYGLGCWQMGMFGDIDPERIRVGNVWVDRSGREHECFANIETYSPTVTQAAIEWLSDVVYAVRHDEEAQREPSREFCADWCPRFSACRASDTDVHGLLTDPDVLAAVDLHIQASAMKRQASKMDTEAKNALYGINGSTGSHTVRWVHVNGGHVSFDRQGYERLDIKAAPPPATPPKGQVIDLDEAANPAG